MESKKCLLIGATGQVGKRILGIRKKTAFQIVPMVRDLNDYRSLISQGFEVHQGDLEGDLDSAFKGMDSVIFSAGSGAHTGPDKTLMVDLFGALRVIDLCRSHGIRHLIMVSALRVEDTNSAPASLRPYLAAKEAVDRLIQSSDIPFTILRPGKLHNEAPIGITITREPFGDISTSRDLTAEVIIRCLGNKDLIGKTVGFIDGSSPFESDWEKEI